MLLKKAIDLDFDSNSLSIFGTDGKSWIKVNLGELNCIHQVLKYDSSSTPAMTHTCNSEDCSSCEGTFCSSFLLTIKFERTSSDSLPPVDNCKYGDTVKLHGPDDNSFRVTEFEIIGKRGEIRYW